MDTLVIVDIEVPEIQGLVVEAPVSALTGVPVAVIALPVIALTVVQ